MNGKCAYIENNFSETSSFLCENSKITHFSNVTFRVKRRTIDYGLMLCVSGDVIHVWIAIAHPCLDPLYLSYASVAKAASAHLGYHSGSVQRRVNQVYKHSDLNRAVGLFI